jgi:hypothetical protein
VQTQLVAPGSQRYQDVPSGVLSGFLFFCGGGELRVHNWGVDDGLRALVEVASLAGITGASATHHVVGLGFAIRWRTRASFTGVASTATGIVLVGIVVSVAVIWHRRGGYYFQFSFLK